MTTTDNDRRILHSAFEKACGPRPAEILMEHLPPAGWRDLATKSDVESASLLLRTDMEVEFANVRTEMRTEFANIRTEMRTEFANIRTEMADLRTELVSGMEKGFRSQTWKMIGAIVASQSTTMGMVALMLR
jgi:hypothetical protein